MKLSNYHSEGELFCCKKNRTFLSYNAYPIFGFTTRRNHSKLTRQMLLEKSSDTPETTCGKRSKLVNPGRASANYPAVCLIILLVIVDSGVVLHTGWIRLMSGQASNCIIN
jgi:hypothetical protein